MERAVWRCSGERPGKPRLSYSPAIAQNLRRICRHGCNIFRSSSARSAKAGCTSNRSVRPPLPDDAATGSHEAESLSERLFLRWTYPDSRANTVSDRERSDRSRRTPKAVLAARPRSATAPVLIDSHPEFNSNT